MERQKIHYIYSIFLSILLTVAGLCLMVACVGIYNAGDQPFSREAVATAFHRIAIPVYLCLGGVIVSFLLNLLLPEKRPPLLPVKNDPHILNRLHQRVDLTQCDEYMQQTFRAFPKKRRIHQTVSGILLGLGSVIFLCYALNSGNYHDSQINGSMIRAVKRLLICMGIPFLYSLFTAYYCRASIRAELKLLKTIQPTRTPPRFPAAAPQPGICRFVPYGILAVAVIFLLLGLFTGGTADVMTKAINICTECVGLG
jgi:hypothetical protein